MGNEAEALLSIGLLIIVAKVAEGVFRRFGLNSIIAYAATGILLGPVLGVVEVTHELSVLLGIGIFVFFFLIGLDEIDISAFVASIQGRFFVAAIVSLSIALLGALAVTTDIIFDFNLGLSFTAALALSGVLALSSLGLVAKVLSDGGHLREPVGIQIFTTVIIAELMALLVVGFTIGGEQQGDTAMNTAAKVAILLGQIAGFTIVTWVLSRKIVPLLIVFLQKHFNVPQLSFGLLLGGLFLMVILAERIGLHSTIGALLFGAALSGLPHQLKVDIMPGMRSVAGGLFVPLFFASAGLHFSLAFTNLPPWTIVALVLVPLAAKVAGALIGSYLARLEMVLPMAAGLMAKGVAEVALLLVLFQHGDISREVFSLMVLVMLCYIFIVPMVINFAIKKTKTPENMKLPNVVPSSLVGFALDGVKVREILDRSRSYAGPGITVRRFVDTWVTSYQDDYVVVDRGIFVGIVSLSKLRYLPRDEWATVPLRNVLRHELLTASPEDLIEDVLQRMTERGFSVMPVIEDKSRQFLGSITSHDVLDHMLSAAKGEHVS